MASNSTGNDAAQSQQNADSSIGAFISSLLVNTAVAAAMFVAFCIVRHWNRKIFQPRTYLVPEEYVCVFVSQECFFPQCVFSCSYLR